MPRCARSFTLLSKLIVALVLAANARPAIARDDVATTLTFEDGDVRGLAAWNGKPSGPAATLHLDSTVVHGGRYAGRIERDAQSASSLSSLAIRLPVDFTARTVELRGWIKVEGVSSLAALWQRQDGDTRMLQFDEMRNVRLSGTHDWQEFSSILPLSPRARTITVGALLSGQGRVWVDDLRILVDGRPLAEATKRVAGTALDGVRAFDEGSGIAGGTLSHTAVDNLALLAKTWGFLKYHHPAVVNGTLNWDHELFREMRAILAANDRDAARAELSRWITRLGPVA